MDFFPETVESVLQSGWIGRFLLKLQVHHRRVGLGDRLGSFEEDFHLGSALLGHSVEVSGFSRHVGDQNGSYLETSKREMQILSINRS